MEYEEKSYISLLKAIKSLVVTKYKKKSQTL